MPTLNNEVKPRGWSRAGMALEHLTERQINNLDKSFEKMLLGQIGGPENEPVPGVLKQ